MSKYDKTIGAYDTDSDVLFIDKIIPVIWILIYNNYYTKSSYS